jgi:hypothetical protein
MPAYRKVSCMCRSSGQKFLAARLIAGRNRRREPWLAADVHPMDDFIGFFNWQG